MRIILSRKGLDSQYGGIPSPILPNGEMLSLPIPETERRKQFYRYRDIRFRGESLDRILEKVGRGRARGFEFAHPDPDLSRDSMDRQPGWRPAFGQALAAESHLVRQGVEPNDLFLFFGWFRDVDSEWHYTGAPAGRHIIFGWLQVDHKVSAASRPIPSAVSRHPHFAGPSYGKQDAVYVAREQLQIPGIDVRLPGAGLFPRVHASLVLTAEARQRSIWDLPSEFADEDGRLRLSYHSKRVAEKTASGRIRFPSVARGQEFVIAHGVDVDLRPWLEDVFGAASGCVAS